MRRFMILALLATGVLTACAGLSAHPGSSPCASSPGSYACQVEQYRRAGARLQVPDSAPAARFA